MAEMLADNSSLIGSTSQLRTGLWRGMSAFLVISPYNVAGSLEVYVKRVGSPGNLLIKFYEIVFGQVPVGGPLYEFTMLESAAVPGSFDWYTIDLGQTVFEDFVETGKEYAIVLAGTSDSVENYWEAEDGYMFSGLTWTDGSGWNISHHGPAMILWSYEQLGPNKPTNPIPTDGDIGTDFSNYTLSWTDGDS